MTLEQYDPDQKPSDIGEVNPVSTLASTYDDPERGYWFVGFQRDGRVVRYVEPEDVIEVIGAEDPVEKEEMYARDIEAWVHDEIVNGRLVQLHPRFNWLKRMAENEFFESLDE